ncbi:UPF0236 family transposase-like protein [Pseudalkalibacillus sp. A8]|uniref:UPF0236 family transposase-like protein n=1 Tax=Pseudalkalibacillus sp. A8 TaxID=3382641 RepID=UPI0038B43673
MKSILEEIDEQVKNVFGYRRCVVPTIVSLFGEIEMDRNYYRDTEKGEYVFLLDRYLNFKEIGTLVL